MHRFATVTNAVKKFACGGLSFPYFTPIYITIYHYILACGGLSSLLYFNFVQNFIIYLCTIVKMLLKKFRLRRAIITPA